MVFLGLGEPAPTRVQAEELIWSTVLLLPASQKIFASSTFSFHPDGNRRAAFVWKRPR